MIEKWLLSFLTEAIFLGNLVGICGVAVDAAIGEISYGSGPINTVTIPPITCACDVYTYVCFVSVNRTDADGDVFPIAVIINANH